MIPQGARVLLRAAAVDFRKGPEGLVSLVRDAGADPFDGSLYVFRAKRADRIKMAHFALAMHGAATLSIPAAAAMTTREDGARGSTLR